MSTDILQIMRQAWVQSRLSHSRVGNFVSSLKQQYRKERPKSVNQDAIGSDCRDPPPLMMDQASEIENIAQNVDMRHAFQIIFLEKVM